MALDWTAGALGFVGGAAGTYQEQQKKQREWNLEQAAKDAEMERLQNYTRFKNTEALKQQKALTEQEWQMAGSEEGIAHRSMLQEEAIAKAKGQAVAAEEGKLEVMNSEAYQENLRNQDQRKLDQAEAVARLENTLQTEFTDTKQKKIFEQIDATEGLTDNQKSLAKLQVATGVKIDTDKTTKMSDELKGTILKEVAKEADAMDTKDIRRYFGAGAKDIPPGQERAYYVANRFKEVAASVSPKVASGKTKATEGGDGSVLASDSRVSKQQQQQQPARTKKKTFDEAMADLKKLPQAQQQAELEELKAKNPNLYNKAVKALRDEPRWLTGVKGALTGFENFVEGMQPEDPEVNY